MNKIRTIGLVALLGASGLNGRATLPPLSGLQMWLRADTGVTTNGSGYVTGWADQSGSGRNLSWIGLTDYTPTLVTNALRGGPVVNFDGGSDGSKDQINRDNADVNMFASNQVDIFIVMKPSAQTTFFSAMQLQPDVNANRVNLQLENNGTWYFDYGNIGAGGRVQGATPAGWLGAYHIVELARETSGAGQISLDQLPVITGTFTDTLDPTTATRLSLSLAGDVAEVLIYNRALTGSERATVNSYLEALYIPEPSVVALLIAGGLLVCRRRQTAVNGQRSTLNV